MRVCVRVDYDGFLTRQESCSPNEHSRNELWIGRRFPANSDRGIFIAWARSRSPVCVGIWVRKRDRLPNGILKALTQLVSDVRFSNEPRTWQDPCRANRRRSDYS